jgi:hypothetical protein
LSPGRALQEELFASMMRQGQPGGGGKSTKSPDRLKPSFKHLTAADA